MQAWRAKEVGQKNIREQQRQILQLIGRLNAKGVEPRRPSPSGKARSEARSETRSDPLAMPSRRAPAPATLSDLERRVSKLEERLAGVSGSATGPNTEGDVDFVLGGALRDGI